MKRLQILAIIREVERKISLAAKRGASGSVSQVYSLHGNYVFSVPPKKSVNPFFLYHRPPRTIFRIACFLYFPSFARFELHFGITQAFFARKVGNQVPGDFSYWSSKVVVLNGFYDITLTYSMRERYVIFAIYNNFSVFRYYHISV